MLAPAASVDGCRVARLCRTKPAHLLESYTGRDVEDWAQADPPQWESPRLPKQIPCTEVATAINENPRPSKARTAWAPWGVLLAGKWGRGKVMASFEQLRRQYEDILGEREPLVVRLRAPALFYSIRIPENTRQEANRLCARLRHVEQHATS